MNEPGERKSAGATEEALAAVIRHLEGFNRGDVDAVCGGLAKDVVFATGQDVITGRDEARRFFADALGGPVELGLHLRRAIVQGDEVACELRESIIHEGVTHEESIAAFYTVRAGLLSKVKIYREGTADIFAE